MAVRYDCIINNDQGLYYKWQILDSDYVGSATELVAVDIEFDYKGQNNNRWDSVWGSQVTLVAKSTASINLDTLISDIQGAEEGRFNVVVEKSTDGVTYNFEWIGIVLNDLSNGTDEMPTTYEIVAVDGLGALKGINFNVDSTTPLSTASAGFTLIYALKKLPYNSYFASSDDFLKSCVRYFESQMQNTAGSPLNWTVIPNTTFYSVDKNGEYTWDSCYQVIEKICNLFNCRIYFAAGTWRIIDIREWETASSIDVFTWTYAGAVGGTTSSENLRYTIDGTKLGTRVAFQSFGSFPALRKVERVYKHDTSRNLVQGITVDTSAGLQTVQNNIPETGDESLVVSGALQFSVQETAATGTAQQVFVKLRLTVKYGIYYLNRPVTSQTQNSDYTGMTWENTTSYIEYIGVFNVQFLGGMTMAVNFETPALPNLTTADLEINLEKVYIQDLQQNDLSGSYSYSATFGSLYIEYLDGDAENERTYHVENNTSAFLSEIATLSELNVGDKTNPMTQNRLLVFDGTSNVDSEGNWGRDSVTGNTKLLGLVLEDVIAGQRTSIKKRQGQFIGAFDPWRVLAVSGEYYLPLGVRFSVKNGSFDGEWYKTGTYNDSGLSNDFISIPPGDVGVILPPSIVPPSGGGTPVNPIGVVLGNGGINLTPITGGDDPLVINNPGGTPVFTVDNGGNLTNGLINNGAFGFNTSLFYLYGGATALTTSTGIVGAFFGISSGENNTGSSVAAFGANSASNNTGEIVTAVGTNSLSGNSGDFCVALGTNTLENNTGDNNTAIGYNSLQNATAENNTAVGYQTLISTSSVGCTAIGYESGYGNTGNYATGVGFNSIRNNTADNIVGVGRNALFNNTGTNSCGLGYAALFDNTGSFCNGFGLNAMYSNTGLRSNSFGNASLQNNQGNDCNGMGLRVLQNNEGDNNNGMGSDALRYTASTSENLTAIGHKAAVGTSGTPLDFINSTALGANSTITADNQVSLGDSSVTNFRFGENMEIDLSATWYAFSDGSNDLFKIGVSNNIVQVNAGLGFFATLPAASALNGTIYEDSSDNRLYYKNSLGTVTALT